MSSGIGLVSHTERWGQVKTSGDVVYRDCHFRTPHVAPRLALDTASVLPPAPGENKRPPRHHTTHQSQPHVARELNHVIVETNDKKGEEKKKT